mmetsp:Transcript_27567/g.63204  ORF Transcript_27567/g.63204 Transcript_27567/m.63204 type:complete len:194 (-) Transcript_27567:422-1003(-)
MSPSSQNTAIFLAAALAIVSAAQALDLFPFISKKRKMESVVRKYFEGVTAKDPKMIRSCFPATDEIHTSIRDVCGIDDSTREVRGKDLVERCTEFLGAHPDTVVNFHYGPICDRTGTWVVAHWYEVGTWTGSSCGISPSGESMAVEGQTRFKVCPRRMVITDMVVTRTFAKWEVAMLEKRRREKEQMEEENTI